MALAETAQHNGSVACMFKRSKLRMFDPVDEAIIDFVRDHQQVMLMRQPRNRFKVFTRHNRARWIIRIADQDGLGLWRYRGLHGGGNIKKAQNSKRRNTFDPLRDKVADGGHIAFGHDDNRTSSRLTNESYCRGISNIYAIVAPFYLRVAPDEASIEQSILASCLLIDNRVAEDAA